MRYLVDEAKADVNAAARNGLTPLHVGIYYEYPEVSVFSPWFILIHAASRAPYSLIRDFWMCKFAAMQISLQLAYGFEEFYLPRSNDSS